MKQFVMFILFLCLANSTHTLFEYDRAINATKQGNLPASIELFKKALVDQPDNPELLYDAGVSSFKNKEYTHAVSYFQKSAESSHHNQPLQEQAYFNAGNTFVELKELQKAIDSYDAVLKLNPTHKQALHNKEVVKKMLEQQKQQQEQEQKKQNNDQQEHDKNQKQSSENAENNDQQEQQQKNQEQSPQEQQSNDKKQSGNTKNEQKSQNRSPQSPEQSGGDKEQSAKQQEQKKQEQSNERNNRPDQQKENSGSAPTSSAQKDGNDSFGHHKLPAKLEKIMAENANNDNNLNKKMMKAMVGQQSGASHEHNW